MSRSPYPVRLRPMTALVLVTFFPCVFYASGFESGQAPDRPTAREHREHKRDYKREIEVAEEQWRQAQLAYDVPTMDRLLATDYLGITMTGEVTDKTQQLERIRNRDLALSKIELSEKKIKLVGDVAIVTSLASIEGTNHGAPLKAMVRYTRIYRRYPDGSWRITNFEVTRVPKREAPEGPSDAR